MRLFKIIVLFSIMANIHAKEKNIYQNWWNKSWNYRTALNLPKLYLNEKYTLTAYGDFSMLLKKIKTKNKFDSNSIRVIIDNKLVPSNFIPDKDSQGSGRVVFSCNPGKAFSEKQAFIYFDTVLNGKKKNEYDKKLKTNLIINPDFEGKNLSPWKWKGEKKESSESTNGIFKFDTINLKKPDAENLLYPKKIPVVTGAKYLFSFHHKCEKYGKGVIAAWVNFHYPKGLNGPRRTNLIPKPEKHDWIKWGKTIEIPKNAETVTISIIPWKINGYLGYWDDFEFYRIDSPVLSYVERKPDTAGLSLEEIKKIKIKLIEETWEKKPFQDNAPMNWISDENRKEGFVAFETKSWRLIYPETRPSEKAARLPFKAVAALNEYEPLVLAVHALRNLPRLNIKINGFLNKDGNKIPEKDISLKQLKFLKRKLDGRAYRLAPSHLEKIKPELLSKGKTRQYWITVFASENCKPGVYRSSVDVFDGLSKIGSLPLEFTILPFKLADPDKTFRICDFSNVYRYQKYNPGYETMLKQFKDIKAHGIESTGNYCRLSPFITWKNEKMQLDFDKPTAPGTASFSQTMKAFQEAGLKGPVVWEFGPHHILRVFLPQSLRNGRGPSWAYNKDGKFKSLKELLLTPEYQKAFQEIVRKTFAEQKKRNWPELLPLISDEPHGFPGGVEMVRKYISLLKEAMPENTPMQGLFINRPEDLKEFQNKLDVICVNFLSQELLKTLKASKSKLYLYNLGSFNQQGSKICGGWKERYIYGLLAWNVNADGVDQYAYSSTSDSPKDEPAGPKYGDTGRFCMTVQSPDGPLPTPSWEAVREGIDDYRCIRTLEILLEKNKNAKGKLKEAIKQGKLLLEKVKKETWENQKEKKFNLNESRWKIGRLGSDIDFAAIRNELIAAIIEIKDYSRNEK